MSHVVFIISQSREGWRKQTKKEVGTGVPTPHVIHGKSSIGLFHDDFLRYDRTVFKGLAQNVHALLQARQLDAVYAVDFLRLHFACSHGLVDGLSAVYGYTAQTYVVELAPSAVVPAFGSLCSLIGIFPVAVGTHT